MKVFTNFALYSLF